VISVYAHFKNSSKTMRCGDRLLIYNQSKYGGGIERLPLEAAKQEVVKIRLVFQIRGTLGVTKQQPWLQLQQ
jgi:hypothetical protein